MGHAAQYLLASAALRRFHAPGTALFPEGYTRQGREAVSYHMHLEAATDEFGLCLGIYVSDIPDSGLTFMSHKIPAEAVRDVS